MAENDPTNPPEPTPPTPPAPTPPEPATPPEGEPKSFTQDDVNKIAARERAEAKRAATKELADTLGVSIDEAKELIKQKQDADAATMSEAEKAAKKASEDAEIAAKDRAEAAKLLQQAKVKGQLTSKGVETKSLDDIALMVAVDSDADDAAIEAAVDALAEKFPALFQPQTAPAPGKKTPSSVPGGPQPKPAPTDDAYQRGVERAKALKAKPEPKTLFTGTPR